MNMRRAGTQLSFDVAVAEAQVLSDAAAQVLQAEVAAFARDVFDEASRFEAAHRGDSLTGAEFTSTHIVDGAAAVRRKLVTRTRKQRGWSIAGKIALYVAAAGIGIGGNMMFVATWALIVFVASLVTGLFIVGLLEMSGSGNE